MKTRIVILFLSLLMPMSSVVSQVSDLGAFEGLVDGLADKAAEEPLMPEDEIQDNQKDLMQPKIIRDFRDKNYSFTGGTSFLNPPQSKFFDEPLGYFGYDFLSMLLLHLPQ